MDIIAHKCLEGFHRKFIENDSNPLLKNNDSFSNIMDSNYSGENLVAKIINTDEHWNIMLNTKGFGKDVKYEKAQEYKQKLIKAWNTIKENFDAKNEIEISKLMGQFLWDMKVEDFKHSYFGVIEMAIKNNKLWKSKYVSDIFCYYLGFIISESKTLEELANKNNLKKERIRQIKVESIKSIEQDFWFLKDNIFKDKFNELFDIKQMNHDQIYFKIRQINDVEGVKFSKEFYMIMISLASNTVLVGNINTYKSQNKKSLKGNIWKSLYHQTQEQNNKFNLEHLIDDLAVELKNKNFLNEDKEIDISDYSSENLSDEEIQYYNSIIKNEIDHEIILTKSKATIKRNSIITQNEMAENALEELGGLAYIDEVLDKVVKIYPEKNWDMKKLRISFRGTNHYVIGKSGIYGLKHIKDLSSEMGNGTFNEVAKIYLSNKDTPIHVNELFEYFNELFPRPKTLHTIQTFLQQNNKGYFIKYESGFYGLVDIIYSNISFPKIAGGNGKYLISIINENEGISFEDIYSINKKQNDLLEVQVKYLLNMKIEKNEISEKNGLYHKFVATVIEEIDDFSNNVEEIIVEIDQEELDNEELNQPDIPDILAINSIAQIQIRRGQPKFRQQLLKLYKKTCIVTDCKIPELLEAAHIKPYSKEKKFNLSNGLLLRADIHTLFDLGMIAIEPESLCLKLNKILKKSSEYSQLEDINIGERISKLHNKYNISEKALYYKWSNFKESE